MLKIFSALIVFYALSTSASSATASSLEVLTKQSERVDRLKHATWQFFPIDHTEWGPMRPSFPTNKLHSFYSSQEYFEIRSLLTAAFSGNAASRDLIESSFEDEFWRPLKPGLYQGVSKADLPFRLERVRANVLQKAPISFSHFDLWSGSYFNAFLVQAAAEMIVSAPERLPSVIDGALENPDNIGAAALFVNIAAELAENHSSSQTEAKIKFRLKEALLLMTFHSHPRIVQLALFSLSRHFGVKDAQVLERVRSLSELTSVFDVTPSEYNQYEHELTRHIDASNLDAHVKEIWKKRLLDTWSEWMLNPEDYASVDNPDQHLVDPWRRTSALAVTLAAEEAMRGLPEFQANGLKHKPSIKLRYSELTIKEEKTGITRYYGANAWSEQIGRAHV